MNLTKNDVISATTFTLLVGSQLLRNSLGHTSNVHASRYVSVALRDNTEMLHERPTISQDEKMSLHGDTSLKRMRSDTIILAVPKRIRDARERKIKY